MAKIRSPHRSYFDKAKHIFLCVKKNYFRLKNIGTLINLKKIKIDKSCVHSVF